MYQPSVIAPTAMISAMVFLAPAEATADTPREILTTAAFQTSGKARALALVGQAVTTADKILATHPGDHEAMLQRGIAIGYRARLTKARSDAKASLAIFTKLAAQNPRDAEAQLAIAGWHLDAVDQLGRLIAGAVLGAKEELGEAALAHAVLLGGDRAIYPGVAALMQIRNDPKALAQSRKWAEQAAVGNTPTPVDAIMKRAALAILPALRAGDGKAAAAQASKLLPFGKLGD